MIRSNKKKRFEYNNIIKKNNYKTTQIKISKSIKNKQTNLDLNQHSSSNLLQLIIDADIYKFTLLIFTI